MVRRVDARLAYAVAALLLAAPAARAGCTVTTADPDNNTTQDIVITGDAAKQILKINIFGANATCIQLDCNGDGDFTDTGDVNCVFAPIESITADLKGKDDITVFTYGGSFNGETHQVKLLLGPGGNTVTIRDAAAFGQPFVSTNHSSFVFDVVGGTGNDAVTIDYSAATNSVADTAMIFRGDLGAGNDTLTVKSPTTGLLRSDWDVDIALGIGNNIATVNHQHAALLGASKEYSRYDIEGGDSTINTDTVVMDVSGFDNNDATARLFLNSNLRGGNDTFVANFDADVFYTYGYMRLRANGGTGNDTISVSDTGSTYGGMDGTMDFGLKGGLGNDTVSLDWFNTYSFSVPGTFRARVDGGDGNDLVLLDLVNNPFDNFDAVKPNLDLYATGGRGADSVLLLSELFFGPTLGPLGIPLVSGGLDPNDTCIANTASEQLSCELN